MHYDIICNLNKLSKIPIFLAGCPGRLQTQLFTGEEIVEHCLLCILIKLISDKSLTA